MLYRSSGDHDEYFDISEFRYNRSSFVLTLCPAGLQIELRYKRNFDISELDIAGLCCIITIKIIFFKGHQISLTRHPMSFKIAFQHNLTYKRQFFY